MKGVRTQRSTGLRYTGKQRAEALLELQRLVFEEGYSRLGAARKLHISRATLNRWESEENKKATEQRFPSVATAITSAIEALVVDGSSKALRRDAILRIAIWMRYPDISRTKFNLTLLSAHCSYLASRHGSFLLEDLKPNELAILLRTATIPDFSSMIDHDPVLPDSLENYPIGGRTFNDHDVLAKVFEYLISTPTPGHTPSIAKAHRALLNGAFGYNYDIDSRTFRRLVNQNLSALAFIWAGRNYSSHDWAINPADETFIDDVDDLLSDPMEIHRFLAAALGAQRKITRSLNQAILARGSFPSFPPTFNEADIEIPPASKKLIASTSTLRPHR